MWRQIFCNAAILTRGCWVWSVNAISMLCSPIPPLQDITTCLGQVFIEINLKCSEGVVAAACHYSKFSKLLSAATLRRVHSSNGSSGSMGSIGSSGGSSSGTSGLKWSKIPKLVLISFPPLRLSEVCLYKGLKQWDVYCCCCCWLSNFWSKQPGN